MAALNRCQARGAGEPPAAGLPTRAQALPQATGDAPPPVLDLTALQRLRITLGKQADAMLPGLIDSFFLDALKLIANARNSLEQAQTMDLRRAAHSLKSSSATFGAMALSEEARELEYKARDGVLEGAAELLARIEAEHGQARAALSAWRDAQRKEA